MTQYEITNEEWERIKDLLPPERTDWAGRPGKDNRTMLNGILWVLRSGAQWLLVPVRYGKRSTIYDRFARWRDKGVLQDLFEVLAREADWETVSIDSTSIKVHQSANDVKPKTEKAVGIS
ncbi:MAG: IS5 family transposase [Clostridiaceae bacterium]